MEESNRRVLAPWRQLYPLTAWRYRQRVKQVCAGMCGTWARGGGHGAGRCGRLWRTRRAAARLTASPPSLLAPYLCSLSLSTLHPTPCSLTLTSLASSGPAALRALRRAARPSPSPTSWTACWRLPRWVLCCAVLCCGEARCAHSVRACRCVVRSGSPSLAWGPSRPAHPLTRSSVQESGEKWSSASEVQLCFEVKTFLLAGHETSAAMLCWSLYELSQVCGWAGRKGWSRGRTGCLAGGRVGGKRKNCAPPVRCSTGLLSALLNRPAPPRPPTPPCPERHRAPARARRGGRRVRQQGPEGRGTGAGRGGRHGVHAGGTEGGAAQVLGGTGSDPQPQLGGCWRVWQGGAGSQGSHGCSVPAHRGRPAAARRAQPQPPRTHACSRTPLPPPPPGPWDPQDDELCGHSVPRGSWVIVHLQGIHHQYDAPLQFRPDRFMPGGEYDAFPEDVRPFYVSGPSPRRAGGLAAGPAPAAAGGRRAEQAGPAAARAPPCTRRPSPRPSMRSASPLPPPPPPPPAPLAVPALHPGPPQLPGPVFCAAGGTGHPVHTLPGAPGRGLPACLPSSAAAALSWWWRWRWMGAMGGWVGIGRPLGARVARTAEVAPVAAAAPEPGPASKPHNNTPPPSAPQRFTFTPQDVARQGEPHPTVIPVAPKHGMRMLIS